MGYGIGALWDFLIRSIGWSIGWCRQIKIREKRKFLKISVMSSRSILSYQYLWRWSLYWISPLLSFPGLPHPVLAALPGNVPSSDGWCVLFGPVLPCWTLTHTQTSSWVSECQDSIEKNTECFLMTLTLTQCQGHKQCYNALIWSIGSLQFVWCIGWSDFWFSSKKNFVIVDSWFWIIHHVSLSVSVYIWNIA